MKILMQSRPDAFKNFGGDTLQMVKIKEHLRKIGVKVDIDLSMYPNLKGYDLIHLFNITRVHETYLHYKNAKSYGIPIVITPIYHSKNLLSVYYINTLSFPARNIFKVFRYDNFQIIKILYYLTLTYDRKAINSVLPLLLTSYKNQQVEILCGANLVIVNSELELQFIKRELNLNDFQYRVVLNGVSFDFESLNLDKEHFLKKFSWLNMKDFVFYPARIEPLKNQVNFIMALMNEDFPLVFAGKLSQKHPAYCRKFLKLLKKRKNTFWIGELTHREMFATYSMAKVVALASWFETAGLVGLEGGLMGCNVVMTTRGYTKEYFQEYVWYCEPDDFTSIRNAVLSAYSCPRDFKRFSYFIKQRNLTWENTAKSIFKIYKEVLSI